MAFDKNFPPAKGAVSEAEAAIDDLLRLQGRPAIYGADADLLALNPEPPICSFCGKGTNQVERILQGEHANICSQCVLLCYEILRPDLGSKNKDESSEKGVDKGGGPD
jgi:hypothetical protein